MGKKLQQLTLTVGLLLYLFDVGTDIYVAIQYWKNNDVWWFVMTISLILVPSIILNITAIVQVCNSWRFIKLSFVGRYIETIISPYSPVARRSETTSPDRSRIYFLAKLRYVETITESAPQLCLQVYIMLRQWDFPAYTVVSSVLSLLSLTWSITKLEKEIIEEEDCKISAAVCFLSWQVSTIVSRLFAIFLFAYVFRYYAIIFLVAYWLRIFVAILIIERRQYSCGESLIFGLVAYISPFHVLSLEAEGFVYYIFIILENIAMVTLSLTIEISHLPHMDILKPAAISCLVGGSVIPIVFYCCIVLYHWRVGAYHLLGLGDVITFFITWGNWFITS